MHDCRTHSIWLVYFVLAGMAMPRQIGNAQALPDPRGDVAEGAPAWTDIVSVSVGQDGTSFSLAMATGDTIPRQSSDSCQFQFLLRTGSGSTSTGAVGASGFDQMIVFDFTHWDGSPWFSTNVYSAYTHDGVPKDTVRVFDWKLQGKLFTVRFSLNSLGWDWVQVRARTFYKTGIADAAPDTGLTSTNIDRTNLESILTRSSSRTSFAYPSKFDSVLTRYNVMRVVDAAYGLERELTGVAPIGGDTVRFKFNPYYGGAAIEGDPIYLGPGMWGKQPLWFVYFHEMGHNFMNVSARFRQLYPLEMRLLPGPLPTHILFYEAWASLPAMYAYEMMLERDSLAADMSTREHLRKDWYATKGRFEKAWAGYKEKPLFTSLNPDIVDGMFLELRDRFGWKLFSRYCSFLAPPTTPRDLFDVRLEGDTEDLRSTRSTLTAAMLSAAAGQDLKSDFIAWGFPIDERLFKRAFRELMQSTEKG